ncbi:MAG: transcriptional regulator NrdR, partial [Actinomycetota bacterium]|nr:transcriptional regulator NrdR [Actinomycetota bacterium]
AEEGAAIRRRRECAACGQRFSTYERSEQVALGVRKRHGALEPFERTKLAAGIEKATKNLPVEPAAVRQAVTAVENRLRALGRREVASEVVGAEVLAALRDLDRVAYLRFASVYKGFTSTDDFARELATLGDPGREPSQHRSTQPKPGQPAGSRPGGRRSGQA